MMTPEPSERERADAETTEVHTRILRLALGVEESRAYWANVDLAVPLSRRAQVALEARWFGAKSLARCRFLIATLAERYDGHPSALGVLSRWRGMDPAARRVICHWHLQLSDPLYRAFTARFLPELRGAPHLRLDRAAVLRWLRAEYGGRWSEATLVQFASKLLSAASEAGLISAKRDPRSLLVPRVPDVALAYLLQLLRGVRFDGTLVANPYLRSVELVDGPLEARLRALPGIAYRRMGDLVDLEWSSPSLQAWAEAAL
jgi:hypothetical protein